MLDNHDANLKEANILRNKLNNKLENSFSIDSDTSSSNNSNDNFRNKTLLPEDIQIGMTAFVIPLQKEGIVQSLPNRSGEVLVQIGNAKMNVKINNLRISENGNSTSTTLGITNNSLGNNIGKSKHSSKSVAENNLKNSKVSFKKADDFKAKNATTEINVIGLTVEEATQIIDKYLDNCILAGIPAVRIVHGKGTGKLMQGIHAFLKRNPYVKSFRIGAYGEGDLGVTVVELKN